MSHVSKQVNSAHSPKVAFIGGPCSWRNHKHVFPLCTLPERAALLLLPVWGAEQVRLQQLEQKSTTDGLMHHSLCAFLASLSPTAATSVCQADFPYVVILFLLPSLSFSTLFSDSLSLSAHHSALPFFPTVTPISSSLCVLLTAVP